MIARIVISAVALVFAGATLVCADWTVPLSISGNGPSTAISFGVSAGASNQYDAGKDAPARPYGNDLLYASFPHPEWNVSIGGETIYGFQRDLRSTLPQTYDIEIRSSLNNLTISWPVDHLPNTVVFTLRDTVSGALVDMSQSSRYTFSPGGTAPYILQVYADPGDTIPPSAPSGVSIEERSEALFISWDSNYESDLAGYKVRYGAKSGQYQRINDVKNVNNYSLLNLKEQQYYYVVVTAYDKKGNESDFSSEVSAGFRYDPDPPVIPVGLFVKQSGDDLVVNWVANTEPDLAGYNIWFGSDSNVFTSKVNVAMQESYTLKSVQNDKTYFFAVSAYDSSGNESERSSVASFTIGSTSTGEVDDDTKVNIVGSAYIKLDDQGGSINEKRDTERKRNESSEPKEQDAKQSDKYANDDQENDIDQVAFEVVEKDSKDGKLRYRIFFDDRPWKLLSIPLNISKLRPFVEFAARDAEWKRLTGWDKDKQAYMRLKSVRPGSAFWLRTGQGYCEVEGRPVDGETFPLSLQSGWNLIGNPYLVPLQSSQLQVVVGEKRLSLEQALRAGLLATKFRVNEGGELKEKVINDNFTILPWQGYWLQASKPCQLILSNKSGGEIAEKPHSSTVNTALKTAPHD